MNSESVQLPPTVSHTFLFNKTSIPIYCKGVEVIVKIHAFQNGTDLNGMMFSYFVCCEINLELILGEKIPFLYFISLHFIIFLALICSVNGTLLSTILCNILFIYAVKFFYFVTSKPYYSKLFIGFVWKSYIYFGYICYIYI